MHLKRVEMENFKSFRKVSIPVLTGFTGITGPNGSGKSNISDAVLFVLGTHSSKAIRADRLVELIHNGGKKGRAATECSVSLVFDNTDRTMPIDADEVTLRRNIKKSPSDKTQAISKYYVNDRPSKLQEFVDLLAHARISADGYNITQQGDVTRLVEMSDVERRKVLDEIAGIGRFDADIDKANRERDEVDQKLEQIRVVMREITTQLKSLDREKDRAQEYRELRERLEVTKATLAKKRLDGLNTELANIHESVASYQAEGETLREKGRDVEARIEAVEAELAELGETLADMGGEEAREREERIQELREEIAKARQMANHLRDEIDFHVQERAEVEGTLKKTTAAHEKTLAEADEVAAAQQKWRGELEEVEAELDETKEAIGRSSDSANDLQRELAELRQDFETAHGELHAARLEAERLTEKRERLAHQAAEAEERAETARFEHKDLAWELKETRSTLDADEKNRDARRKDLMKATKRRAGIAEELKDVEPQVRTLRNKYSQLKAEVDAAENVQGAFSRAVEAVLAARDEGSIRGVIGTIAELGTPNKGYETALEVAAGGGLQAIVVEDDSVASKCIEHLKSNKLGRATFLPLNKMKTGRPSGQALMKVDEDGVDGFAKDLVSFDERYAGAFWWVYRDTIIVNTLASARKIMGGVRMVTRDGEIIDPRGAMTGGSLRKNRKLAYGASRRDELETLGKELRAAVERADTLAAELQDASEAVQEAEEALREVERTATTAETRHKELTRLVDEAEQRMQKAEANAKEAATRRDEVDKELVKVEARVEPLEARVGELEDTKEQKGRLLLKSTQKKLADQLESLRERADGIKDTLRDFETQANTLAERAALYAERLQELVAERDAVNAKIEDFEAQIEAHEAKAAELGEELQVLEEVQTQQSSELKEVQDKRDEAVARKYELENELRRIRDSIDANSDLIVQFKGRVPTVEAAIAEARAELATHEVEVPEPIEQTQDELKGDIRDIERRMQRLEPVNMRALEEFEELEARKDELEDELEQLELRRQSLVELVEELMGRKKEGLMKVYTEVAGNFRQVYHELSGGGNAELILENETDPFEGGLVLKAQPIGKRVRRLQALSGGEKSLAALSFIFSVQRYAPSPFYVLDEVDMFLDGVNSELVATMVKRLSDHAQFIMVSLRKVTLKEADHVYGVTIANGVSQLLGQVNVDEITEEEVHDEEAVLTAADDGGD